MDAAMRKLDDEHFQLRAEVAVSPQFFGWIFSLGKDVKVVGPKEVVEEMKEAAEAFLENFKE